MYMYDHVNVSYEPRHDKTNKVTVRPAKTQIRLGIYQAFFMRTAETLIRLGRCWFCHVVAHIFSTRGQHDQQLKMKDETLSELENKIKHLREELQEEREKYQTKVCKWAILIKHLRIFKMLLYF